MERIALAIDTQKEVEKITTFIKDVLKKTIHQKVVIGLSGGIDSTTSLYLLRRAMPSENIIAAHLPYFSTSMPKLPQKVTKISICNIVDTFLSELSVDQKDVVRAGNIMARVRMVVLYDLAKKHKALVCGTENRSEYYLAYFTRFGDEASDFEPIRHLFKTQVYQLARSLGVPEKIINQSPTAGLWQGQTDEGEFGFSYAQADQVLHLYFDKKLSVEEIKNKGLQNAKKIIEWVKRNEYKHKAPYAIEE